MTTQVILHRLQDNFCRHRSQRLIFKNPPQRWVFKDYLSQHSDLHQQENRFLGRHMTMQVILHRLEDDLRQHRSQREIFNNPSLQGGHGSDVEVTALGRSWRLHKLYLCQSAYFSSMFSGRWGDGAKDKINIVIGKQSRSRFLIRYQGRT